MNPGRGHLEVMGKLFGVSSALAPHLPSMAPISAGGEEDALAAHRVPLSDPSQGCLNDGPKTLGFLSPSLELTQGREAEKQRAFLTCV